MCVVIVLDIALHLAEICNLLNALLVVRLINTLLPSNFKFQCFYHSLNVLFSVTHQLCSYLWFGFSYEGFSMYLTVE